MAGSGEGDEVDKEKEQGSKEAEAGKLGRVPRETPSWCQQEARGSYGEGDTRWHTRGHDSPGILTRDRTLS